MVCLGNICRSPLAEGIMQLKIEQYNLDWTVESAGTSSWHIGKQPHKDSINIALEHNIDISQQKARQFIASDFAKFDLILAMDSQNYIDICKLAPTDLHKEKVKLILNYTNPNTNKAVPDPYYEGGFDVVFDMIEAACQILIKKVN